jgi:parvulin-like peptidyl-prolyl isomerase
MDSLAVQGHLIVKLRRSLALHARPLVMVGLLWCGAAQAWQAPAYPTTSPAGVSPPYPSTSNYPQTPAFDNTVRGGLPSAPHQPRATMQPQHWAGAQASDGAAGPYPVTNASAQAGAPRGDGIQAMRASAEILQPGEAHVLATNVQILATVASDPILASDVLPYVEDIINANKSQIPPDQLQKFRTHLIMQRMRSLIDTKTVCNHARQKVPKENMKNVEKKIGEVFEEREVPQLMKKAGCATRQELVEKMKEAGTSIDRERQSFFEATLAKQWMGEQVRSETSKEITHDEMLAWYHEHAEEYATPAKARWQQLTVRTDKVRYKNQAQQKIFDLGNMVVVQGIPFADVAKQYSDGTTAADGGLRDWTTQGSLVSKELDKALFTLEIGKMSPVIEDEQGYHIIMVLERQVAGKVDFLEAQVGIKDKIKKERQQNAIKEFLAELKKTTPVWTVFDNQAAEAVQAQSPARASLN